MAATNSLNCLLVTSVISIKKPSTVTSCAGFSLGIAYVSVSFAPCKNVFPATQIIFSGVFTAIFSFFSSDEFVADLSFLQLLNASKQTIKSELYVFKRLFLWVYIFVNFRVIKVIIPFHKMN